MADDKAGLHLTNVAECLYRRGEHGTFYAIIKRQGRQFWRSLKTKDRKLAERRLAVERQKVAKAGPVDAANWDTFTDLAHHWLARALHRYKPRAATRVKTAPRQLGPHFDRLPLKKITRATCEEWERKRGLQVSASSFNAELGVRIQPNH